MEVISLDANKVKIYNNKVIKITNNSEIDFLLRANDYVKNLPSINLNGKKYVIKVPKIYNFENNVLTMERCFGDNIELVLRNNTTHKYGSYLTNEILKFLLLNNVYWQDFAPRNILIDDNAITIMDFERGITDTLKSLQLYFVNSVYEEYGIFLLPSERYFKMDDYLTSNDEYVVEIDNISSKRVKKILNILGYNYTCPISKYILAVKMIIVNEEPRFVNNKLIFPILELEEYLKNNGYEAYAKRIVGDYYEKIRKL